MCGIAGFVSFDGAPASVATLSAMIDIQRHRGPDDQGMRLFSLARGESVECRDDLDTNGQAFDGALGFNRLSILDLSERGHQPMCNQAGTVFIAFNGEVYNAFEYTAELVATGFRFRSRTDTEVILHLYERYGFEAMLERLDGMFAIVIVDLSTREIHAARDHMGIKPFYWVRQGDTLLFASEVKSFLAHPAFSPQLDVDNVDEYLAFRYCAGDRHLLRGVRQLKPGHRLLVRDRRVTVSRFWQIPDRAKHVDLTPREAGERLGEMLRDSVTSQLLSDVKVGCQLSGGIDSSLVTLLARRHCAANIDAFSVVFADPRYSEERWISHAATVAGVDSHRFLFTKECFFDGLETATWHLDQPVNHPNSLGILLLARQSRPLVTVLLSGEGADELFGGYPRFYHAAMRPRISPLGAALRLVPLIGAKAARRLGITCGDPTTAFITASQFMGAVSLLEARPDADYGKVIGQRRAIFAEGRGGHLGNCLKYEMQTYMVDLLVRQDKMTMAHSLENRVPFLDRRLVEFVRTLPEGHLVGHAAHLKSAAMRNTKKLLKELAAQTFDDRFVYRTKAGFGMPLGEYHRDRRFESLVEDVVLPGMRGRGLLRADVVEKQWRKTRAGGREHDESLWIFVAFELWARQFLDGGWKARCPPTRSVAVPLDIVA